MSWRHRAVHSHRKGYWDTGPFSLKALEHNLLTEYHKGNIIIPYLIPFSIHEHFSLFAVLFISTYFDHLVWSLFSRPLRFYYIIFIQFRRVYVLNGYMHYITSAHSCPFSPWIFSYKSTFQSEALVIEQGLMSFWIQKFPRINLPYWRMS